MAVTMTRAVFAQYVRGTGRTWQAPVTTASRRSRCWDCGRRTDGASLLVRSGYSGTDADAIDAMYPDGWRYGAWCRH